MKHKFNKNRIAFYRKKIKEYNKVIINVSKTAAAISVAAILCGREREAERPKEKWRRQSKFQQWLTGCLGYTTPYRDLYFLD